jgi:hypothetical protein
VWGECVSYYVTLRVSACARARVRACVFSFPLPFMRNIIVVTRTRILCRVSRAPMIRGVERLTLIMNLFMVFNIKKRKVCLFFLFVCEFSCSLARLLE